MPITLGEQQVRSGDLIMGDADGVVVVPKEKLAAAARELDAIAVKEAGMEAQIKVGGTVPDQTEAVLAPFTITRLDES